MGNRRLARELALQILFEVEFQGYAALPLITKRVLDEREVPEETQTFLSVLLDQWLKQNGHIDDHIEQQSDHWKLFRMSAVDRNILRLGVTEILFFQDIPKSVTINEYLEIAKKYGTQDSSGFINGILDKIAA